MFVYIHTHLPIKKGCQQKPQINKHRAEVIENKGRFSGRRKWILKNNRKTPPQVAKELHKQLISHQAYNA